MAFKPTLTINGYDITDKVALNSYQVESKPVYSDSVTTMDGVEHVVLIRTKAVVDFQVNPLDLEDTAELCEALKNQPCEVYFYDPSAGVYRFATMTCEMPQLLFINRLVHLDKKWHDTFKLTLTEL